MRTTDSQGNKEKIPEQGDAGFQHPPVQPEKGQFKRTAYWEECSPEEKVMKKNFVCPMYLSNNYSISINCDKSVIKMQTNC
jgi:hypothetical protein